MKTICEIIKDLLPLYHDDVCSTESRVLVEEHIQECNSCKKLLSDISDELTYLVNAANEAKPIKAIQSAWEKDKAKSFFKGTLITVLICTVLVSGFLGFTQWKIISVSTNFLEVSEVCQLSDGRIVFFLAINDDKELYFFQYTTNEDGSFYITPKRAIIERKQSVKFGQSGHYLDVDLTGHNANEKATGYGIAITSCYVGTQNDRILIWEEGMELPAANEYIEDMFNSNK